jgi:hypothetical protein
LQRAARQRGCAAARAPQRRPPPRPPPTTRLAAARRHPQAVIDDINAALEAVRAAQGGEDAAALRDAVEGLHKATMKIGETLSQSQAGGSSGGGGGDGSSGSGGGSGGAQ